ncbi:3-keto-disaccharide hydrolase [Mucilaginibacter aquaedulcis]|uniref:3-keto-disaccharide hydrolase n=1 Tax=Mucilaginibacter aquaedulcis TaxID=1187081 RepID=UPI0025B30756|nr:DUF1080 domain-containing protein [Mucilaginibacter aquaedulcis]MDN3550435.1 DUF1080 domain-containing protein [Mucilaginibacter aquaedulcis]
MKQVFSILAVAAYLSSCQSPASKSTSTPGNDNTPKAATDSTSFVSLFDEKTTKGWHTYGKDTIGSAWKAEDGVLHLDASQKGDWQTKNGGDIVSDQEYENFDFKTEWKISRTGNSGIMFYVHEDPAKYQYAWYTGPECQVADNKENEDGKLIRHRAGDLYDLLSISKDVVKPAGEWNQVEIVANKGKLDIYMNKEHVLSTTLWDDNWKKLIAGSKFKEWPAFGTFKTGRIALQDHGADVWFRNIEIKKL